MWYTRECEVLQDRTSMRHHINRKIANCMSKLCYYSENIRYLDLQNRFKAKYYFRNSSYLNFGGKRVLASLLYNEIANFDGFDSFKTLTHIETMIQKDCNTTTGPLDESVIKSIVNEPGKETKLKMFLTIDPSHYFQPFLRLLKNLLRTELFRFLNTTILLIRTSLVFRTIKVLMTPCLIFWREFMGV